MDEFRSKNPNVKDASLLTLKRAQDLLDMAARCMNEDMAKSLCAMATTMIQQAHEEAELQLPDHEGRRCKQEPNA